MGSVTGIHAGRRPDAACAVGDRCSWSLEDDANDNVTEITGILLGAASSQMRTHNHSHSQNKILGSRQSHPSYRDKPCSACRWSEIKIIGVEQMDGVEPSKTTFAVSYIGHSTIPGEVTRHSLVITTSAYTVVETLTQVRDGSPYIPRIARLALSEAAGHNSSIETAWIERPA